MSINFNELQDLLGAIAKTDIAEVTLKTESFELTVRRGGTPTPIVASPLPNPVVTDSTPVTATTSTPSVTEPVTSSAPSPVDKKWVEITSPMVGTFYRAPAPDESPFVEIGDRIGNGQTVCIIEAMKLMNEIEAEMAGEVMEIVVANGEPVEYGQTLMWVNPN